MFTDTVQTPIKSTYAPIYEKIEQMRNEYKVQRLASLNHKLIAGIALSTKEMLERELLAA
jgi:hypothetical protein